jgi:hypothetical protein
MENTKKKSNINIGKWETKNRKIENGKWRVKK